METQYIKKYRQDLIIKIISTHPVETQWQLQKLLEEQGVHCTQATLSRDIKALGLIKLSEGSDTVYRQNPAMLKGPGEVERLHQIARLAALSIASAQNVVIIKTLPGMAGAVCSFIDRLELQDMVGSVAGNDAIFLAMSNNEGAVKLVKTVRDLLEETDSGAESSRPGKEVGI